MTIFKSLFIFVLAGLCEIGGGYLIWLWLKEGKPLWYGLVGGFILPLYGVIATLQTSSSVITSKSLVSKFDGAPSGPIGL
jgi:small multidrug resistance family-3 protein